MSSDPPSPPPQNVGQLSYFTPPAAVPLAGAWREGRTLIISQNAVLPDRCVKCNTEADVTRYRKRIYWCAPWVILIVLLNWIIGLIIYMILRKSIQIDVGLCRRHRSIRLRNLTITWLLVLGSIGGAIACGMNLRVPAIPVIICICVLVAALIFGVVAVPILKPKKVDKFFGWFSGAGPDFLSSLDNQTAPPPQ